MRKAFEAAVALDWAIEPQWLATILEIANREGRGPEAVAQQLGRPLDNTRTVTVRDGVAIIPVTGPIFRYANAFGAISGGTSVQVLARDFAEALASDEVDAILLEVNSPGGEVTGINEFAQQIADARGVKPITAYAAGACCSAAYWIASAADEIVADATAIVGSIGVVAAMPNPGAESSRDIEIVSSRAPKKRVDASTKEGRKTIQERVDALEDVFVSTVARNRAVSEKTVVEDFGEGGVLVGAAAVKASMVDRLGSLESTITALREQADAQTRGNRMAKLAFLTTLATVLGMAATASEEDVTKAVEDREAERREMLAVTGGKTIRDSVPVVVGWRERAGKFDDQAKDLAKLEASKREGEVEKVLDDGLRAGKRAIARDRTNLLVAAGGSASEEDDGKGGKVTKVTGADPKRLALIVGALPVEVATDAKPAETPAAKTTLSVELTAKEKARCKRMGWDEKAYAAEKARQLGATSPAKEG